MPAKVPADVVVSHLQTLGEFVRGTGDPEHAGAYWIPFPTDGADPGTYRSPVRVTSAVFRGAIHEHFPSVIPTKSRCKDYVEVAEAAAYTGRTLPVVGWSDSDGRGPQRVIRVAINPTTVVAVSAKGLHAEPNGQHAIYRLPTKFDPIWWSDLADAATACPAPCALQAVRRAITDDLPDPTPDAALSTEQQAATVLSWWAGLLMEPACRGRPLLVMLGEPGSGKTLTAMLLGVLYYGEQFEVGGGVSGGRAIKDLAASMVHVPFVVADDLTNVKREAVDTLCRLATGSEIQVATLHETMALSSFKARAGAILTSARPEWALRDDLLSRILPVRYNKPAPSPLTSQDRIDRVLEHRTAAWYELLSATSAALAGRPRAQCFTRFEDWEQAVRTIADHGGWEDTLVGALGRMDEQRVKLAAAASLEVGALYGIAKQFEHDPREWTVAELYDIVMERMGAMLMESPLARPSGRMRMQEFVKFLRRVETEGSSAVTLHSCGETAGQQRWTIRPKA